MEDDMRLLREAIQSCFACERDNSERIGRVETAMRGIEDKFNQVHRDQFNYLLERNEKMRESLDLFRQYLHKCASDGPHVAIREVQAEFRAQFGVWKD